MGEVDDLIAAGLAEMCGTGVAGEAFTLRGTARVGIVGELNLGAGWSSQGGGAKPEYRLSITFPLAVFTPELRVGEQVTARSRTLKVDDVKYDATSITLECTARLGN